MSKKIYQVIHKKSNVVNDGAPKLPQASLLEYGEIAVNYGVSGETLSIKNSADQIVTFPSRDIIDRMVEGKGYLTGYTETDPTVPSWAKAESKPSYTASEVGAMATSERGNYLTTATTIPSIAGLVASVDYDSTGKTIVFYDSSDNVVDSIDATDFIKDGMVDSVAIATPTGGTNSGITCLVVTFNTDAGKEDIEIPLSNIFNPANYYNKTQADQTFLSQSAYTEDEEVVATALNDLNDRIEDIHSHVPSNTSDLNNDSGFITSAYTGFSSTGHTHSQYSTTAHTHTAAEVGAMATSERSNYLTTGTTIPNIFVAEYGVTTSSEINDAISNEQAILMYRENGSTATYYGKLFPSKYTFISVYGSQNNRIKVEYFICDGSSNWTSGDTFAVSTDDVVSAVTENSNPSDIPSVSAVYAQITGHTHSQYSTTAHTHTAAEVGAMATSERSNYLTTGTTLDSIADGTTRKLSDYLPLSGGTVNGNIKISGSTNYLRVSNGGKSATLKGDSLVLGNIVLMNPNAATVFGANNIVFQQKDGTVALLSDVPTEANIEASGFTKNALTGYTETDPTVPSWAKEASKPTYTAAEVGAMATSERGNYSQTGHTHTAAEVGAMATSERSNYATTAHTHTAADVGAMATSERNNYLTTATTIPTTAAEVGAMATSERSNYLTTGTTLDNVSDGTTRKLSNYSTTGHSHTAAEVGAMATSERSNYSTTAHTHDQYSLTSHTHDIYSTTAHTHDQYISGITYNGTAVTVTNGVAAITGSALPTVTSADNGKVMMVVNGAWALVTPTTVYTGSNTPQNSLGNDGDIYLQTE